MLCCRAQSVRSSLFCVGIGQCVRRNLSEALRGGAAALGVQYPQSEGVYPLNEDTFHGNYLQRPNILADTVTPSPLPSLASFS